MPKKNDKERDLIDEMNELEELIHKAESSECPNCKQPFDGIECHECGFDTGCYDPNWD